MKQIKIFTVDAFTNQPFLGNPAGVIFGDSLSYDEMGLLAKEINLSETAFILKSEKADYKVKYFTPTMEINFCGHATIAIAWVLKTKANETKDAIMIETNVGLIPIHYEYQNGNLSKVSMKQAKSKVKPFELDLEYCSKLIGVNKEDILLRNEFKIAYTGNWHLLVEVKSRKAIDGACPNYELLEQHNQKYNLATTHLFTFDIDEPYFVYTRDFAPAAGIHEDPVTGSANGALAAYLKHEALAKEEDYVILQGNSKNRFGELFVETKEYSDGIFVLVKGQAVIMFEGFVVI